MAISGQKLGQAIAERELALTRYFFEHASTILIRLDQSGRRLCGNDRQQILYMRS